MEKKKKISKGSVVDKDTMVASNSEVEEAKNQEATMDDNEEMEKEESKDEKLKTVFDDKERKVKKKGKEKNDQVLVVDEKRKQKKRDRTTSLLSDDKETKKQMGDAVVAGNEEERNKEKRDDRKAADCEVSKSKKKKVRFSDEVKVSPPIDFSKNKGGLVQGKRFTEEEDELIRKAISDYIEAMNLGEEGLDMVLHCSLHPELKDCWKQVAAALPWRPYASVYQRAHKLYENGESKWTPEEVEFIRNSYKKHGPNWKMIAGEMGKSGCQVRHVFQRYRFGDPKKGKWSQEECQALFELVNKDLQMKVFQEKKWKYGMLRDNISWNAISQNLRSRHSDVCSHKWYRQLTSPMVAQGIWADVDDYRLVSVLLELDASCEDEVDWDTVLGHRSGDLCRKRWLQMVRHLGNKSFSEHVEILSKRYCPDLAQVREAWDAKPFAD